MKLCRHSEEGRVTLNGDEMVLDPQKPNRLIVLPRDGDRIFEFGSKLLDTGEWMRSSGKLTRRFNKSNFEPFDTRE